MTHRKLLKFVLACFIFWLPLLSTAQGPPGEGEGDPDAPVPIDGGLSLLLAAGVGYGVKKIHDSRKKKSADSTVNYTEK